MQDTGHYVGKKLTKNKFIVENYILKDHYKIYIKFQ